MQSRFLSSLKGSTEDQTVKVNVMEQHTGIGAAYRWWKGTARLIRTIQYGTAGFYLDINTAYSSTKQVVLTPYHYLVMLWVITRKVL